MNPEEAAYIAGLFDGEGTITYKVNGKRVDGTSYLKQWRWRCTFRDAYYVCLLIWPYAHTKLSKINKILEHYYTLKQNNIVDIRDYKESLVK